MDTLVEGEDFYYNEEGYMVLTEKYPPSKRLLLWQRVQALSL
jgi:hypothetical protein